MTLENGAWDAWKSKNAAYWDPFLTTNFMGYGNAGRIDRTAAMKEYAGTDCDVKNVQLSDERMMPIGTDAAVLIYKVTVDATCGGKKLPANMWAAGAYVRDGDKWKGAFHAETPVTDPNAPPTTSSLPPITTAPPASTDQLTQTLMAVETKAWDSWKNRDAKGVEDVMAANFTSLSGSGPKDKAESVKAWSVPKCENLSYTLTDPKPVQLSKDAAMILYRADAKGTCDGKPVVPTMLVASIDSKEGDTWKNAFYMEVPK
jgi:hypothetical protein